MHRFRLIAFVLIGGLLSFTAGAQTVTKFKEGESANTVTQRQLLVGTWQGKASLTDGGSRTWIVRRRDDGTYRIDFTYTDAGGGVSKQSEAGIWGTSAGLYFTATRSFAEADNFEKADTTDPTLYDIYKIVSLTQDSYEYENLSTGNHYTVKRVAEKTDDR